MLRALKTQHYNNKNHRSVSSRNMFFAVRLIYNRRSSTSTEHRESEVAEARFKKYWYYQERARERESCVTKRARDALSNFSNSRSPMAVPLFVIRFCFIFFSLRSRYSREFALDDSLPARLWQVAYESFTGGGYFQHSLPTTQDRLHFFVPPFRFGKRHKFIEFPKFLTKRCVGKSVNL